MRWIVISLILINALVFGWRWWTSSHESPETINTAPPIAADGAIELLPEGTVAPITETDSAQDEAANAESVPTNLLSATEEANPEDTNSTDAAAASDGTPTAGSDGVATAASVTADAPISPSATAPEQALVPPTFCAWTVWQAPPPPLEPGVELVHAETREQEVGRSYLVYIPGKGNREQTLERLAEIKALGLEAAFLNKGPQTGGISLGLFSKPESMATKLAELKTSGVTDALGTERIRTETQQRQLLRWIGEKTPNVVTNQALVSCNDVAQVPSEQ